MTHTAMVFIESALFTEDVTEFLSEESYAGLQVFLAANPEAGDVIRDSGGLRKLRWSSGGKGKRGGVRVIYYFLTADSQIRMLLIYRKSAQDSLAPRQKAALRKLNEGWN